VENVLPFPSLNYFSCPNIKNGTEAAVDGITLVDFFNSVGELENTNFNKLTLLPF
jgi:hypothetical protein